MKLTSDLLVDAPPAAVVDVLADLSTYPAWNDLVSSAEAMEELADDAGPAWRTTLTAKVGPFARSKQLRFVRTVLETDEATSATTISFSRSEDDDRSHAAWTMECSISPEGTASRVHLTLAYGGSLWVPALGSVLDGAIERSTLRLPAYVQERT